MTQHPDPTEPHASDLQQQVQDLTARNALLERQIARLSRPVMANEPMSAELVARLLARSTPELNITYELYVPGEDEQDDGEDIIPHDPATTWAHQEVKYLSHHSVYGIIDLSADSPMPAQDAQLMCMARELAVWGLKQHLRADQAEARTRLAFSRFGTVRVPEDDLHALNTVTTFAFQKIGWNGLARGCDLDNAQITRVAEISEQLEARLQALQEARPPEAETHGRAAPLAPEDQWKQTLARPTDQLIDEARRTGTAPDLRTRKDALEFWQQVMVLYHPGKTFLIPNDLGENPEPDASRTSAPPGRPGSA